MFNLSEGRNFRKRTILPFLHHRARNFILHFVDDNKEIFLYIESTCKQGAAMPKFGSHIIIAELAAHQRPDLFSSAEVGNALRLGAVGPDLTLFLFDPITKPEIRQGFDTATGVLRF